jgi:thiamine-phosphate pyrophosphorylase
MSRLRGVYAITPEHLVRNPQRLLPAVGAALSGGIALLQYRDKWNTPPQREALARELLALCRSQGVPLIINDDAALAARIGADGVHLGASDGGLRAARALLGPQAVIGATCGNSLKRAQAAVLDGADYVAFGRFFASRSKPDAPPADLDTLRAARAALPVPVCAIGGVTPLNAPALIGAGADLIAAIGGVFGHVDDAAHDVETAARAYNRCFETA